jgi:hypothetical protein
MSAQSETGGFVPFNQFLASTEAANSGGGNSGLVSNSASRTALAVQKSFGEMKQHILSTYQDVKVSHSYALGSQTFDCVPVEQQPAVRKQGLRSIAAVPPALALPSAAPAGEQRPVGQTTGEAVQPQVAGTDAFGNTQTCEEQTIPMRRITLDELTRFKDLDEFFSKGPDGAGRAPVAPAASLETASTFRSARGRGTGSGTDTDIPPAADIHKHAFTYQYVNNLGGNSVLNLWSPYVYTPWSEIFSLSQVWYLGTGGGTLQSVEAGWQNYPAKYGSENAALFVYSTRDNYRKPAAGEAPVGCYNLDCGIFVQVNHTWALGSAIGTYSSFGGTQYELPIQWWLYAGNWWLNVNGTWIGYYPGSFYRGGQLSRNANLIEFGGETVSDGAPGYYYYPPMGSGNYANAWWQQAAYQKNIYYYDTANTSQWANLTAVTEAASCYTTAGPYSAGSAPWGVYFFFGGPGGWCN